MYYHQRWSESDTVKLIGLYEKAECLWNPENEHHKNFDHQDLEIEAMVQAMEMPGLDENELKSKIKMIRNIYALELHKIECRSKHYRVRKNARKNIRSNVKWFPIVDKFLRNVIYFDVIWEGRGGCNAWDKTEEPETHLNLMDTLEDCLDSIRCERPPDICYDTIIVKDRKLEENMEDWSFKLMMMTTDQRKYAVQMINGIIKRGLFQTLRLEDIDERDRIYDRKESIEKILSGQLVYSATRY